MSEDTPSESPGRTRRVRRPWRRRPADATVEPEAGPDDSAVGDVTPTAEHDPDAADDTSDSSDLSLPARPSPVRRVAGSSAGLAGSDTDTVITTEHDESDSRPDGGRGLRMNGRRPRPGVRAVDADISFAAGDVVIVEAPPGAADLLAADPDAGPADDGAPAEGEPPADAGPSRAGRNLPAAFAVGIGLGAIIIASLFLYRPSFAIVVGLASLYGLYELGTALRDARIRVSLGPLLVGGAAMLAAAWLRGVDGLAVAGLVVAAALLVWRIADGARGYTRDAVASVLALVYVPLLAGFAVMLAHPHDGAARVLVFIATVVCSDTGGYATGVLIGKHPMAPVVSKAKTWEGFAGSVVACSAAGVLFFSLTFHQQWWKGLLYGLAIVVVATLGDLGESMVKRDLDIKDMGRLLPGHGGVMDRLDSLLPCAAVAYLLLMHLAPV